MIFRSKRKKIDPDLVNIFENWNPNSGKFRGSFFSNVSVAEMSKAVKNSWLNQKLTEVIKLRGNSGSNV